MDLVRLKHMGDYWRDHPPVHLMVAAYLGIGKNGDGAEPEPVKDSAGDVLDMLDPQAP